MREIINFIIIVFITTVISMFFTAYITEAFIYNGIKNNKPTKAFFFDIDDEIKKR
jgi:hypothetical protein